VPGTRSSCAGVEVERSTHGRSLDWSEFSRVHDAREKQTQKVAENEKNGEMLRKQKAEKRKRILSVISE
jgi:hypothetical protein